MTKMNTRIQSDEKVEINKIEENKSEVEIGRADTDLEQAQSERVVKEKQQILSPAPTDLTQQAEVMPRQEIEDKAKIVSIAASAAAASAVDDKQDEIEDEIEDEVDEDYSDDYEDDEN